jgi:hypothetical protein
MYTDQTGVCKHALVILDWKENNYIRSDRYIPSKYLEKYSDLPRLPSGIPSGNQRDTQVRLGKGSIGKDTHPEGGFASFWKSYPRKTAKGDAERAWLKLKPSEDLQATIISAVERAKQSEQWQREGGRFIPCPATYLNGKRWEDEVKADDYQPLIFDQ